MRLSLPTRVLVLSALLATAAPSQETASEAIGEVFASDAHVEGSVKVAAGGMQVLAGSTVRAGSAVTLLRLARGGVVRICPNTTISLARSRDGLMLGMGAGSLELHYALGASADTLLTPDFRMLLAGPGEFHLAVQAEPDGSTCLRSLESNSASIIVSELLGSGTYQVKPGEQVIFRGSVSHADRSSLWPCGCPEIPIPEMRALEKQDTPTPPTAAATEQQETAAPEPVGTADASGDLLPMPLPVRPAVEGLAAQPPLPPAPGEVHVQVDAPFVFRADEPAPLPQPVLASVRRAPPPVFLVRQPAVQGPPAPERAAAEPSPPTKKKRGFFGRIASFFAGIFR